MDLRRVCALWATICVLVSPTMSQLLMTILLHVISSICAITVLFLIVCAARSPRINMTRWLEATSYLLYGGYDTLNTE
jgi:hypothetical protein